MANATDEVKKYADENLELARNMLISKVCNYKAVKNCEVIVVFDAYRVSGKHREIEKISGISIVYTKEAETADSYIEKTSHELSKNNRVEVATSDNLEQIIILAGGALRISARTFLEELKQAEIEIRENIWQNNERNKRNSPKLESLEVKE